MCGRDSALTPKRLHLWAPLPFIANNADPVR